jgi:outer membrane protein insertion porin family
MAVAVWMPALLPGQPVATAPATGAPASPEGLLIRSLEIQGLQRIDEAYVRNQMRTRPGEPFSETRLDADIGRLYRTGRFRDVVAQRVEVVDGMVEISLTVYEKPEVLSITFEGAEEFKRKDLLEVLTYGEGDPLDLFDVRQGREAMERLYKEKGYAYVEVTIDEEALSEQRVVYRIIENQKVRVEKVEFEGNVQYPASELKGVIETKAHFPIFVTGDFDPERAQRDAALLQRYYYERGFLDAQVGYTDEFIDVAREKLVVTFRILEGTRYTIKEIRIEGEAVFTEADILGRFELIPGEYLVQSRLSRDIEVVRTLYGSNGYIDVQVATSWVFAEEPGQVILTFTITEGEQFQMGWIEVDGNVFTQEKCVRRELRFYPEEIFDTTKLRAAEKRLKGTGLFTEAVIGPGTEAGPGQREVLVRVTENDRTNQFIAGAGLSSDSGLLGNIVLENTNFDLFDRPRSWDEFFRGRSFRGAGQTARIQFEPGTEITRFRIDFREPYLMDKPIGFGTSFYLFARGRDGYDEERGGGNFSFDKRFEDGLLAGWTGEVAFRAELVRITDLDSFMPDEVKDVKGDNFLSTVKLSLLHDTTDSRFDPTEGHRINASWEQGIGEFYHAELTAGYVKHWTVAIDEKDRRSVVSARVRGGQILGDAPMFERFYAGGIGSMRGFDYRGISPRDGIRNTRIGGDFMMLTGAEYSFPLVAKVVRGVFFVDMGTVEESFGISNWRSAVGGGVRLTLDIFGTVPMEFDLAVPISKDSEDDTRIFSFFIGLPFF